MAGKHSSSDAAILLVDGYSLLGAKPTGLTSDIKALFEKNTGLGDTFESMTPTGLQQATLVQTGAFFDDSVNGMHAALNSQQMTARNLVFAQAGNNFASRFTGAEGTYGMSYDVLDQVGNLSKANVSYVVSGQVDRGLIIQKWLQKTITWDSFTDGNSVDSAADTAETVVPITSNSIANPTVVTTAVPHNLVTGDVIVISGVSTSSPTINGQQTVTVLASNQFSVPVNVTVAGTGGTLVEAGSTNGGWGYLHVSEMTGPTSFTGKLRSSPDNSTWSDLATFTAVTSAPAAQRLAIVGAIPRYLSFQGAVTGAGTITVFAGLARNPG
jgi:hypothetical protein